MVYKDEVEAFNKYKTLIYFIGVLAVAVTAWNTVVAQTFENEEDIVELATDQKILEEKFDEIQDSVLVVHENQKHMAEDMQEIKSDLKLLIRSLRGD